MKQLNKLMKEVMRTPGPIRVQLLLLMTLTISSVTSTVLQITNRVGNTSEESILHSVESLEVGKGNGGLRLRATGRTTTEVLQNLRPMLNLLENPTSREKLSHFTPPLER